MNCPYCNSPVLLNDVAGNPWYQCGTTKTFRSASCVDREPLVTELRNALARIKRLEEAGNAMASILNNTRKDWYTSDQCEVTAFTWNEAKEAKP